METFLPFHTSHYESINQSYVLSTFFIFLTGCGSLCIGEEVVRAGHCEK